MVLSFDATGLHRIRGKQAPFGGWERMGVNPKVEAKPMVEKGQQAQKCHGRHGVACSFGKNGQALRVSRGHGQCLWCCLERLQEACDRRATRGGLVQSFKKMFDAARQSPGPAAREVSGLLCGAGVQAMEV